MSTIPPILIKLQADVSGLKSGLAQAEQGIKSIDGNVKTASAGMNKFAGSLKSVGAAMGVAFAGAQIVNFAKQSVLAASNMAEAASKVKVVFGESAQTVLDFGKTSATSLGISERAALASAGTYGNLFQALGVARPIATEMSTTLVTLASDLASFNDTNIDDALNALRSGLSGETEPLKRFGVALNDVTLKNKAFAMGFGQIKGVMDPAIKAQVTYALVMEQTKLAQGDFLRTQEGTANTMRKLTAEFENAKVAVGEALMPAFRALLALLKILIPMITAITGYFKENADALKAFALIIGITTAAFYGYRAALVTVKVAQQAYVVMTALMKGATLASIATTNGLAASILMLNAAIRANPIGLIVTAILAAGVAFVYAYKRFETFRNIINKGLQIIINGFGYFLGFLSKVVGALGKLPGMSKFKGMADGLALAAAKARDFSNALTAVKYAQGTYFTYGSGNPLDMGTTTTTTKDKPKSKPIDPKKLKSYLKDVSDIYDDMNKAIKNSNEQVAEATLNRNEDIAKAQKKFAEATLDARKDNAKRLISIEKEYAKQTATIEENLQKKITDLRQAAAEKSSDLIKSAIQKQASIVQQGVDRLRSAFASGTGFNIAEAFKESGSAEGLLEDLKKRLQGAKDLQANAAALAGLGYSQVFIEEVVKNGPEAGNAIAKALKDASPEATKELQQLYYGLEDISAHGLDVLAKTMSTSTSFATEELLNAYNQVGIDLTQTLAEVNTELNKNLAEAQADYTKAMTEAKIVRDENMVEAAIALKEALDSASKDLADSLIEIQKTFQEAINDINKATMEKMAELQKKLKETAALMVELGAKQAAASALAKAPIYTPSPLISTPNSSQNGFSAGGNGTPGTTFNTTVNATTNASAASIANTVTSEIKFGTAVVTLPRNMGF